MIFIFEHYDLSCLTIELGMAEGNELGLPEGSAEGWTEKQVISPGHPIQ